VKVVAAFVHSYATLTVTGARGWWL